MSQSINRRERDDWNPDWLFEIGIEEVLVGYLCDDPCGDGQHINHSNDRTAQYKMEGWQVGHARHCEGDAD